MNELQRLLLILLRVFLFWLAGCLLIWTLFPSAREWMAGLMLGSSVSVVNAHYLGYKIRRLVEVLADNEGKRFSMGFFSRAAIILVAVMVALRLETFDLIATIIGLFYSPVTTMIIGMILANTSTKK